MPCKWSFLTWAIMHGNCIANVYHANHNAVVRLVPDAGSMLCQTG